VWLCVPVCGYVCGYASALTRLFPCCQTDRAGGGVEGGCGGGHRDEGDTHEDTADGEG